MVLKATYMKGIIKNVDKCAKGEEKVTVMKGIISKVQKSTQGVKEN